MSRYQEIVGLLATLPPDMRRLFACSCAQRLMPIITHLASATSSAECMRELEQAWSNATTAELAHEAAAAIGRLPESSIDDSHDPKYYAMLAISVVVDAVHATGGEVRAAQSAAAGALDVATYFDYVLPAKHLEVAEEEAQVDAISRLVSGNARADELRAAAIAGAALYAVALPVALPLLAPGVASGGSQ